jgi:hypothetical protein
MKISPGKVKGGLDRSIEAPNVCRRGDDVSSAATLGEDECPAALLAVASLPVNVVEQFVRLPSPPLESPLPGHLLQGGSLLVALSVNFYLDPGRFQEPSRCQNNAPTLLAVETCAAIQRVILCLHLEVARGPWLWYHSIPSPITLVKYMVVAFADGMLRDTSFHKL